MPAAQQVAPRHAVALEFELGPRHAAEPQPDPLALRVAALVAVAQPPAAPVRPPAGAAAADVPERACEPAGVCVPAEHVRTRAPAVRRARARAAAPALHAADAAAALRLAVRASLVLSSCASVRMCLLSLSLSPSPRSASLTRPSLQPPRIRSGARVVGGRGSRSLYYRYAWSQPKVNRLPAAANLVHNFAP